MWLLTAVRAGETHVPPPPLGDSCFQADASPMFWSSEERGERPRFKFGMRTESRQPTGPTGWVSFGLLQPRAPSQRAHGAVRGLAGALEAPSAVGVLEELVGPGTHSRGWGLSLLVTGLLGAVQVTLR